MVLRAAVEVGGAADPALEVGAAVACLRAHRRGRTAVLPTAPTPSIRYWRSLLLRTGGGEGDDVHLFGAGFAEESEPLTENENELEEEVRCSNELLARWMVV